MAVLNLICDGVLSSMEQKTSWFYSLDLITSMSDVLSPRRVRSVAKQRAFEWFVEIVSGRTTRCVSNLCLARLPFGASETAHTQVGIHLKKMRTNYSALMYSGYNVLYGGIRLMRPRIFLSNRRAVTSRGPSAPTGSPSVLPRVV